jgi:hypothetical protein
MPMKRILFAASGGVLLSVLVCSAQVDPADLRRIEERRAELAARVARLRAPADLVADVAVYEKAAAWILRYPEEFYRPDYAARALAVLERGLARARELEQGKPSWPGAKGRLSRAYRSRVDGSLQPYGLVIPESYDGSRPARLDVVLHGRNAALNEVSFLAAHDSADPVPAAQQFIQLEVYGRGNNAYRWAGETDVWEALASVESRYRIDPKRIVLRGFSMGGAGAWHIGLHHPHRWAAMEAGAGFVETRKYARRTGLPPWQEAGLRIYDSLDWALNAFNLPVVGYGGEEDPQLAASASIREQLAREGFRFAPDGFDWTTPDLRALFLVGPGAGHRFHPDSKRRSDAFVDGAAAAGIAEPERIRFVTWTSRYGGCFWLDVEALERPFERAEVEARREQGRLVVTTDNVARLAFRQPAAAVIDGQAVAAGPRFEKLDGRWTPAKRAGLRKAGGMDGPIDDAFRDSFLCVRPTGAAHHEEVQRAALASLERFRGEFAKWMRGDLREKDDRAVTARDIAESHLVLFGDAGSNRLIARVLGKLPLRWTRNQIGIGGRSFDAARHLPVLIYPNPLNPRRYVVLNSGHTFHAEDFRGTNALLYPRLGDWAILPLGSDTPAAAGLFNAKWQPE